MARASRYATLTAALAISLPASAQEPATPPSLELSVAIPRPSVAWAEPLVLEITLRNVGAEDAFFLLSPQQDMLHLELEREAANLDVPRHPLAEGLDCCGHVLLRPGQSQAWVELVSPCIGPGGWVPCAGEWTGRLRYGNGKPPGVLVSNAVTVRVGEPPEDLELRADMLRMLNWLCDRRKEAFAPGKKPLRLEGDERLALIARQIRWRSGRRAARHSPAQAAQLLDGLADDRSLWSLLALDGLRSALAATGEWDAARAVAKRIVDEHAFRRVPVDPEVHGNGETAAEAPGPAALRAAEAMLAMDDEAARARLVVLVTERSPGDVELVAAPLLDHSDALRRIAVRFVDQPSVTLEDVQADWKWWVQRERAARLGGLSHPIRRDAPALQILMLDAAMLDAAGLAIRPPSEGAQVPSELQVERSDPWLSVKIRGHRNRAKAADSWADAIDPGTAPSATVQPVAGIGEACAVNRSGYHAVRANFTFGSSLSPLGPTVLRWLDAEIERQVAAAGVPFDVVPEIVVTGQGAAPR